MVRGKDVYFGPEKIRETFGIYYSVEPDRDYHSILDDKSWDPDEVLNMCSKHSMDTRHYKNHV